MGVRGALFVLPVIALINYSIIAVAPLLAVVRIGKILENSTDYSIQNTLRQALFLPTTREAKYKAKAAIDTFFTRTGDVVSAGFVGLGQVVGLGDRRPSPASTSRLTVVWLWVARQISTGASPEDGMTARSGRRGAAAALDQHLQPQRTPAGST